MAEQKYSSFTNVPRSTTNKMFTSLRGKQDGGSNNSSRVANIHRPTSAYNGGKSSSGSARVSQTNSVRASQEIKPMHGQWSSQMQRPESQDRTKRSESMKKQE